MPREIAPGLIKQWVEDHEAGKSVASIARAAKKDPRTVQGHIEAVFRQRDFSAGKRKMFEDAIRKHQEDLEQVLNSLLKTVFIPGMRIEGLGLREGFRLPVPGGWTVEGDRSGAPRLEFTTSRHWELLKQHMPKDGLWTDFAGWESARDALLQSREKLWKKAITESEKRTGLKLAMNEPGARLEIGFPAKLTDRVTVPLDGWPLERFDRKRCETDETGNTRVKGNSDVAIARSPNPEAVLDAFFALLKDAETWPQALALKDAFAAYKEAVKKLRRTAEDILYLHFIAGRCDLCKRLGS